MPPGRPNLFKLAGGDRPPDNLRVVFVGLPGGRYGFHRGAPYGDRDNKTWWALRKEYRLDLGFPLYDDSFDLRPWLSQGIWILPTQKANGGHRYSWRMDEMFRILNRDYGPLVFVFIGGEYLRYVNRLDPKKHVVLTYSSRRDTKQSTSTPIVGSRLFTRIAELLKLSKSIWKLPVKV